MYPTLEWLENGELRCIPVVDRVFIGRVCSAVPVDKRILIEQTSVSRDHAVVSRAGTNLSIHDSSRNGTRVNGVRISPATNHPLGDGDRIGIGTVEIVVRLGVGAQTTPVNESLDETTTLTIESVVTHLVADVRGYSAMAQHNPSADLRTLITRLFERFSDAVNVHRGVVKDFAGDAIFAFWEHGPGVNADVAISACNAALVQLRELDTLEFAGLIEQPLRVGWGIATGRVTLSHYGVRQDSMAVIGDATNLAFRLAGLASKTLEAPIVLCEHTAQLVRPKLAVISLGSVETKGRTGREEVYGLVVNSNLGSGGTPLLPSN